MTAVGSSLTTSSFWPGIEQVFSREFVAGPEIVTSYAANARGSSSILSIPPFSPLRISYHGLKKRSYQLNHVHVRRSVNVERQRKKRKKKSHPLNGARKSEIKSDRRPLEP
jgi:hypothetical protein